MKYKVGQEWNYKTRNGEENSTLKILKIEEYPKPGKVIHISIGRLRVKNPGLKEDFYRRIHPHPNLRKSFGRKCYGIKERKSQTARLH